MAFVGSLQKPFLIIRKNFSVLWLILNMSIKQIFLKQFLKTPATYKRRYAFLFFSTVFISATLYSQNAKPAKPIPPVAFTNNKLVYAPDALGNRIPDFSYCGYAASEKPIPEIEAVVFVPLINTDAPGIGNPALSETVPETDRS